MEKAGITTGKFVVGLLIAILVSSAVAVVISTQLARGPQGPAGPNGATGETGDAGTQGPPGPQGPYLPDYDSGWVDITDKFDGSITLTHNLNSIDVIVDVTGKMTEADEPHQFYLGLTGYLSGFEEAYGGSWYELGYSVVQTADGGYAIAGETSSFSAGWSDVYLVKTDASGTMQWNRTYGGVWSDSGRSVVQTAEGGYAIAGSTGSFGSGGSDVYLVKTDANGFTQWSSTYGGTRDDSGYSVVQTEDGGYMIAGSTLSFGAGDYDVYLVRTDADGNMLWNKTYGGEWEDIGSSMVQTAEGGYAIAGWTFSFGEGGGSPDVYLIKTDADGNTLWNVTYGGRKWSGDFGHSVVQTADGGYAIAGEGFAHLIKIDANGNLQWNTTYAGADMYGGGYNSVVQTADGGYAIAGAFVGFAVGYDVHMVKTDASGTMQWNRIYRGKADDVGYSIVQTAEGGYAIAGVTNSFGLGGGDVYLFKTSVESGLAWISTPNTITLYRGATDIYWNYVRVRIWKID